eukprot:GHVP01047746.1.p1 GENE.GHVP01047746.1~~GHVP01047746.1.p1  ORF type:complete len:106 (-),score=14.68 GHVP01047746.1:170-487(-)
MKPSEIPLDTDNAKDVFEQETPTDNYSILLIDTTDPRLYNYYNHHYQSSHLQTYTLHLYYPATQESPSTQSTTNNIDQDQDQDQSIHHNTTCQLHKIDQTTSSPQ